MTDGNWARSSSSAIDQKVNSGLRPREFVMPQKSLENENEIPTIPDVDDVPEAFRDTASTSSDVAGNQGATYRDLESELLKQNSFVALDGVNLAPLLKFIHPDVRKKESDTVWTIESLFKDLSE